MIDMMTAPQKTGGIKRFSGVSILPYLGNELPFSGMSKHGMVMHDGVFQEDTPYFNIEGGVQTYTTGLNENGKEVTDIKDPQLQQQKIMEIRRFIMKCESELGGNNSITEADLNDKSAFYSKVQKFRSVFTAEYSVDNNGISKITPRYWDKLTIQLRNEGYTLNTTKTEDRLKQYIIEARGYGMIAPSLQVAKGGNYSFYLDKVEETSKAEAQVLIDRDEAGGLLSLMYRKDTDKLFYVTKMISAYPLQWRSGKNATSAHLMYKECTNYINGEGIEKNKNTAITKFISIANMDMDDLKIQCYINDGFRLGLLSSGTDGTVTYTPSATVLGKGIPNVFAYLKAGGENEPVYIALSNACEKEWKDD